ncbi:MAG TPA: hypothetical protein PLB91_06920 [Spirochaetales bacterium]|nr:hypothetical protein [Spirochaetales bacterium]HRY52994.1 hypothetical protein [Spirochaetia bacterium]
MDILDLAGGKHIALIGRATVVPASLIDLSEFNQSQSFRTTLASASPVDVSSSNAADAAAGTGARVVRVVGLDAEYRQLYEDITLNGQTKVTGLKLFKRVFGAAVISVGTGLVNAGDIYILVAGTGGTYSAGVPPTITSGQVKILAGYGQAYSGMLTIPAGKTYRATSIIVSGRAQLGTIFLAEQGYNDGVLRHVFPIECAPPMNPVQIELEKVRSFTFPEKTDIRLRALCASSGGIYSAKLFLEEV